MNKQLILNGLHRLTGQTFCFRDDNIITCADKSVVILPYWQEVGDWYVIVRVIRAMELDSLVED